ncbi:Tetraketide alpha-pyrone reductase 1 [Sesamum angolense]|uniref:Tetraketide alpha-pyrone reductase 1 n=1 Tax=Sesamum angolense TaxID=2727404 RepID=A0AAE1X7E4_9LAMI|nr:Tetraketide alpha-pyrone reductase 1 [Sesamum angolense]
MAGKGSHPAFHFIKLQRPDMVAFNRIKATTEEAPLVSAISEDDISTRRAWGLWVCLTEMDKVKYPFKIFSNNVNGSFLLNSMTEKSIEFAESMFEKKIMLIWENKLPATEVTRMKACNMLHVGQWHNHVCPCCEKQEKPLFGTKIRVTQKKPEPKPDKVAVSEYLLHPKVGNEIGLCCLLLKEPSVCEPSAAVVWLEEVRKTESLEYPVTRRSKKDGVFKWYQLGDTWRALVAWAVGSPNRHHGPYVQVVQKSVGFGGDPAKVEHLKALEGAKERLQLIQANLVEEGSFDAAIDGCDGVFHTASPVVFDNINDPQKTYGP